jgi:hypothetical protein
MMVSMRRKVNFSRETEGITGLQAEQVTATCRGRESSEVDAKRSGLAHVLGRLPRFSWRPALASGFGFDSPHLAQHGAMQQISPQYVRGQSAEPTSVQLFLPERAVAWR